MKKALTLSIVIPAYNEEDHIEACLNAISNLSVRPDEVIVVDNNSSDRTAELVSGFPFVRLIHETRQGLYFSRQTGMDAATSEIICRIDADTIVSRHWATAIKEAFNDPSITSVSGPVGYHDFIAPTLTLRAEDKFLRLAKAWKYDFLMGANMALRRSAWELIRDDLCNEPFLFEDIDIATHLKAHGMAPHYLPTMEAWVSGRRFDDNPKNFMRYIRGHTRTVEHHDEVSPLGAYYAEAVFGLIYLAGGKTLYKAYDADERRFSLRRLFMPSEARPNPMAVD